MPRKRPNEIVLPPVHASQGVAALYRRSMDALISAMCADVEETLAAAYRGNRPAIAQDADPADELQRTVTGLREKWEINFDRLSEKLAEHFAKAAHLRSDIQLRRILREGGISVKFTMTRGMRDVVKATVHENVALIKSIPARYLTQVEGAVMRSVQAGRDLGPLAKFLVRERGITKRRAALIARDQNNKASAMLSRARQTEIGIKEAVWLHSHGGKAPRPSHVKMDGKRFDLAKGMWDKDEGAWILPGQLINCRCVSKPVIEGFI